MLGFLHQPSSCWDSFERCCAGGVGGGWLVGWLVVWPVVMQAAALRTGMQRLAG